MTPTSKTAKPRLVRLPDWESLLFLVMICAHLAPIWAFQYFPTRDGPVHIFNASVIREYADPGSGLLREYFTLNPRPDPTWFAHLALSSLLYLASPRVAERIILSFCVILLPLGVRYAVRAVDHKAGFLSILAFPFTHNYFLHMGFHSFSLSLAMTFFVLGYWLRHGRELKGARILVLGLLTVVLYFFHVFSLFMVYIAVAILIAWGIALDIHRYLADGTFGWSAFGANLKKTILRPLAASFPSLLLVAVFLLPRKMVSSPGKPLGERAYDLVHLMSLASFDDREVWITAALACTFAMLFFTMAISRPSDRRIGREDGFLAVLAVYLLLYFTARETELATPGAGQGGSLIHMRLNPFPYFMLILWFAGQKIPSTLKRTIQIVSIGLAACLLGIHTGKYVQLNNELKEYLSVTNRIEDGSTLLPLDVSTIRYHDSEHVLLTRMGNVKVDPLAHASHYIAVERHVLPFDDYEATIGYFPVLFRPEKDPYVHMGPIERRPPPVDFLGYPVRTGGRVDYVLLLCGRRVDLEDETRRSIYRQLAIEYERIFTSPRGIVSLYRRKDQIPAPTPQTSGRGM